MVDAGDRNESSKTALGVAVLRAVHQLLDTTPKILDDPVILNMLDASMGTYIRTNPERYQTAQALMLRSHVVTRSRFAEDRLLLAVQRGIRQYVNLGAGFETFAYRQPAWAKSLRLFEIDQPQSQQEKRAKLKTGNIAIPPNLEFVPIDFERTSLADGLRGSSFDPTIPTFFSWLGVMVYLSPEAIDAIFHFVVTCPTSSEIVFTFSPPLPEGASGAEPTLAERVAQHGEPWQTFITPEALRIQLGNLGFSQITIPTPEEIDTWYIQNRQDGLRATKRTTIASAIV